MSIVKVRTRSGHVYTYISIRESLNIRKIFGVIYNKTLKEKINYYIESVEKYTYTI